MASIKCLYHKMTGHGITGHRTLSGLCLFISVLLLLNPAVLRAQEGLDYKPPIKLQSKLPTGVTPSLLAITTCHQLTITTGYQMHQYADQHLLLAILLSSPKMRKPHKKFINLIEAQHVSPPLTFSVSQQLIFSSFASGKFHQTCSSLT